MEFAEEEHRREEYVDLPVNLSMVVHVLRFERKKLMELTASSNQAVKTIALKMSNLRL